jgi:hypothetical protein
VRVDLETLKRLLESDPMGRLLINDDVCVRHFELDAAALEHIAPMRAKAAEERTKAQKKQREREEDFAFYDALIAINPTTRAPQPKGWKPKAER